MSEKMYVPDEIYLTPQQLSERLGGLTLKTLSNWRNDSSRKNGKFVGPPFIKAGSRVLYPLSHLKVWEVANLRSPGWNE